jgi:hypothetical protein
MDEGSQFFALEPISTAIVPSGQMRLAAARGSRAKFMNQKGKIETGSGAAMALAVAENQGHPHSLTPS